MQGETHNIDTFEYWEIARWTILCQRMYMHVGISNITNTYIYLHNHSCLLFFGMTSLSPVAKQMKTLIENKSSYSMLIHSLATHRNELVRTSWVLIDEASENSLLPKYRGKSYRFTLKS